jgi:hypothetical protein
MVANLFPGLVRSFSIGMLFACLASGLMLDASHVQAAIVTYDLAADWSDTVNPNGAWSYGTQTSPATFSPFAVHTNTYINVGGAAFTGNQPAWTDSADTGNNGSPQGLAKSLGIAVSGLDFPTGRIGGHTPQADRALAIRWIAPEAGTIDITGATWMWRDINRKETLSLFVNGVALFDDVFIPGRSDGTTSSNPFLLSSAMIADGGLAGGLLDISVNAGDTVILAAHHGPGGVQEDFVGFDFTINLETQEVPEPASVVLFCSGLLGLLIYRRLRI